MCEQVGTCRGTVSESKGGIERERGTGLGELRLWGVWGGSKFLEG